MKPFQFSLSFFSLALSYRRVFTVFTHLLDMRVCVCRSTDTSEIIHTYELSVQKRERGRAGAKGNIAK